MGQNESCDLNAMHFGHIYICVFVICVVLHLVVAVVADISAQGY
jgi:hypothetical protein